MFLLSVVAYSVVMGALMATGKEVIGRIPKGKVKTHFCLNIYVLMNHFYGKLTVDVVLGLT